MRGPFLFSAGTTGAGTKTHHSSPHVTTTSRRPLDAVLLRTRRLAACIAVAASPALAQDLGPMHAPFDALLHQYVRDGLVDYGAFARSAPFAQYLGTLGHTNPARLPRAEQLAFWINAYNAYTIQQINAHGERASIRNINRTFGMLSTGGAWKEPMAVIGGRAYTLDQIEHAQIRPVFHDARVHFALVCAARGCPPLRSEAYRGDALEQQLDDQARRFLTMSPAKNRVDVASATAFLSPIFKWYAKDFGATDVERQQFIARFLPAGPARTLLAAGRAQVEWTPYDWSLNIQTAAGTR